MRPRRLVIEGLRSFRERVEVDFGDRQLIAVVGHTGAGKSSILEAITYALYGGTTWTAHHGDLISDSAEDMLVELTFDADGKRHRVRRTASATSRPSTAELVNETDGTAIDNVRPVDEAIIRLVGLKRDAFLKSVILPQGRFAELLQADDADRNAVLENIFRIDEVKEVRRHAGSIRDRIAPHVEGLKQRRAALPEDPATALADARVALDEASSQVERSSAAERAANQAQASFNTAATEGAKIRQARAGLVALDLGDLELRLEALAAREEEFQQLRHRMDGQLDEQRVELDTLTAKRLEAVREGLDIGPLAAVVTRLEELERLIPDLSKEASDLGRDEKALKEEGAASTELIDDLDIARAGVASRKEALSLAIAESARLSTSLEVAQRLLIGLDAAKRAANEAETAVDAAQHRDAKGRDVAKSAHARLHSAEVEYAVGLEKTAALETKHAAAHAATDVGPGDACPICRRKLQPDFRRPRLSGLKTMQSRMSVLDQKLSEARTAAAKADQSIIHSHDDLSSCRASLTTRRRELSTESGKLSKHLGVKLSSVDPDNAGLLAPLSASAENAAALRDQLATEHQSASRAEAEASRVVGFHSQHVAAERKRLSANRVRIKREWARLATALSAIPEPVRPRMDLTDHVDNLDPDMLDVAQVGESRRNAQTLLESLTTLDKQVTRARIDSETTKASIENVTQRVGAELTEPLAELREAAAEAARILQSAAHDIPNAPPSSVLSKDRSRASLVRDAKGLKSQYVTLAELAGEAGGVAQAARASAERELVGIFAEFEVEDLPGLGERKVDAAVAETTARLKLQGAAEASAIAKGLDDQLSSSARLVNDLDALRNLLSNRTFVGEILRQRSKALLTVASQRLADMTGSRFAFTAHFGIMDQLTGQPRDAKTLSGGESFLASLALALGMVDLAARAGGRLDALLLDEGFGALDAGSLHSAVDALEATSKAGRMVVVISHLKAIAERIDDVMIVSATTHGSDIAWLDEVTKANLSDEDAQDAIERLLN